MSKNTFSRFIDYLNANFVWRYEYDPPEPSPEPIGPKGIAYPEYKPWEDPLFLYHKGKDQVKKEQPYGQYDLPEPPPRPIGPRGTCPNINCPNCPDF